MGQNKTVFIDIETDRLDPKTANPIQIAMIAIESESLFTIEEMELKIYFDISEADESALSRNSYNDRLWISEAIPESHAIREVSDFFNRHSTWNRVSKKGNSYTTCEIAGHNVASYDAVIISNWFKRNGIFCPAATWVTGPIDTMHMARCVAWVKNEQWGDGYSLSALCRKFEIPLEDEHDALCDARATVELAKTLKNIIGDTQ